MEQSFHRALNEPSYFLTTASSRFLKKAVGRMKCVTAVLQQEQLMENYPGSCSTQAAAAQTPKVWAKTSSPHFYHFIVEVRAFYPLQVFKNTLSARYIC